MYKSVVNEENMSNLTSAVSGEASVSSCNNNGGGMYLQPVKRKRNQPGHPDPGAEVIALSPRSLLATNRFVCEVCNKGFQRDQNLQLHRRGHNLPWKLKQRSTKEVRKKVYICPEVGCVHHDASRALGDLTGIKKHYYRKHGEKKWKCDKCSKKYAVQSDWKAHSKICGTREYRCDCGTVFSRRDSFITHRAFCDALARENVRTIPKINTTTFQNALNSSQMLPQFNPSQNLPFQIKKEHLNFTSPWLSYTPTLGPSPPLDLTTPTPPLIFQDFNQNYNHTQVQNPNPSPSPNTMGPTTPYHHPPPSPYISATALLQKASQMGSKSTQFPSPAGEFIRPHLSTPHVTVDSSRDEFIHSLSSYGRATGGSTENGAPLGGSSNALVHEMMMMNDGVFETSTFDDVAFGEDRRFCATVGQFSGRSNEGKNMTRDFLGLRPLSQSEILSLSGFDDCLNGSSCNDN